MDRIRSNATSLWIVLTVVVSAAGAQAAGPLSFEQLAGLRSVSEVEISPNGSLVAYVLDVPRRPGADDDGPAWKELHLVPFAGGESSPYVIGDVRVSKVRFSADGRYVTYLAKRGDDEEVSLWAIPIDGGESRRWIGFDSAIRDYALSPDGKWIAYVADEPESETREKEKEKGYKEVIYEEDWRPRRVWLTEVPQPSSPADPSQPVEEPAEPRALDVDGAVFTVAWSPGGDKLALTVAPTPLIDDQYMLRRIQIVAVPSGEQLATIENPGKLGDLALSPDGKWVAMITAEDPNDTKEGRLQVASTEGGPLRDLLPNFDGHVRTLAWQDPTTVMYIADTHTGTELGEVDVSGGDPKTHLRSQPILQGLGLAADGNSAALLGDSPQHPAEVFAIAHGDDTARRLTDSNPWLADVELARQEVITHEARDGTELEGILLYPLGGAEGAAPLILIVHGGPEAHVRNGWVTSYSRPGQLAAGKGYAVFYPNYRGSTGRGVAFAKSSQGDAAGKEFDDLVDAVDHLVKAGVADRERVGITGGSYGGYATGWSATRLTEHFRAGVMFVGISNKISKGFTTEIPNEDLMVHTRFDPWTKWQFSLERSPLYYAEQSRTALLIAAGTDDPRVHPSQSLQLYRALKLMDKTPVRLVWYPGEQHGNRKAAARDDYMRRLIRWMDHFLLTDSRELPPSELPHELGTSDDDGEDEDD